MVRWTVSACDNQPMRSAKRVPETPSRKPKADFTQVAFRVFQQAIGEAPAEPVRALSPKAAAGKKGGESGGRARALKLTAAQRSEQAREAAAKRWGRH